MLAGRKLVVDTFSEVYKPLSHLIDVDFWNFAEHQILPDSIYIVSRKSFIEQPEKTKSMLDRSDIVLIFDNAAEGSETLVSQLKALKVDELARQHRLLVIGGGDMEPSYAYLRFDHFLTVIFDYQENHEAASRIDEIFAKKVKPYKFLFLNGRARPHRKYLYERFRIAGLLQQSLWTMLDSRPSINRYLKLHHDGINLMARSSNHQWLPAQYEFSRYKNSSISVEPASGSYVKVELFDKEWGEIYLEPAAYIDTYFSLVTETVFDYPYSFFTEKIAKPLAMGHPWIVASSPGFYRDLKNLGFQTFGNIIDESFDEIDNHQDRMDRVFDIVHDLCQQDLIAFLHQCEPACHHNQQLLLEFASRSRGQFPQRFQTFIEQYARS